MLNLVARTADKQTVLVLEWQRGRLLALHSDADLRVDLLEAQMRLAQNEQANQELFEAVAEQ